MTNELERLRDKCARLEKDNIAKAVQIADLRNKLAATKEICHKKCQELLDQKWKAEEARDALSDCVDVLSDIVDDFIDKQSAIETLCDDWKFRAMDSQNEDLLKFIFKIEEIFE